MPGLLRRIIMAVVRVTLVLGILIVAGLGFATIQWLKEFNHSVTLPNGLVLKRQFDFTLSGRNDMLAADGRTWLSRDIEFVCFNDRYVDVSSYERSQSGLYDAQTGRRVPGEQAYRESGLMGGRGCNGYYLGLVGPGLLYDGMRAPHLPRCSGRNLQRAGLADRLWFERPCVEDDWGERHGTDASSGDVFDPEVR